MEIRGRGARATMIGLIEVSSWRKGLSAMGVACAAAVDVAATVRVEICATGGGARRKIVVLRVVRVREGLGVGALTVRGYGEHGGKEQAKLT